MKYLLVNDTSHTNNPGCHGTVACLRELLKKNGMREQSSLALGFGADLFEEVVFGSTNDKLLAKWLEGKRLLRKRLKSRLQQIDAVILNAEGTLHHNQSSALAILAIIELATEVQVPAIVVNGTVQSMDNEILRRVLLKCDSVFVRENYSTTYLQKLGINSSTVPDCLFMLGKYPDARHINTNKLTCVYTPGVLTLTGKIDGNLVRQHITQILEAGLSPVYLAIENEDLAFVPIARDCGARIVGISEVSWFEMTSFLRQHELVVSGRYHILIYSLLAGLPIIPLDSNTWKIEALLDMVGLDVSIPTNAHELSIMLGSARRVLPPEKVVNLANLCEDSFEQMLSQVKANRNVTTQNIKTFGHNISRTLKKYLRGKG